MARLTTRLRYGLARALVKSSTFTIVPSWVSTSVLNPAFRSLVRDGYQKSSAFFACISVLAFSFPEPPLLVYDDEGEAGQALPQHGLRKLLRRPMPTMGEAELMSTTCAYLAIGGNAYWHKLRGKGGQVVQLRPYHAGQIIPVPGGENWIQDYLYDASGAAGAGADLGNMPRIDPADIVHFKWPAPDPTQPWQSQPPILAAAAEVDSDVEAVRYIHALLKNDAIPRTVVTVPADRPLDEEEYKRTKEQWRERYGGDNRGDVAILEAGATVTRIGLNLQELAFDALAKIPESRIAAAMRVPPIIAGLNVGLARSTFSNYGEARKALAQDTLSPLWRIVSSEITADLLPEFQSGADRRAVEARFDTSRVAALKEDLAAKHNYIGATFERGIINKNEARAALGYPQVADGDTFVSIAAPGQASTPGQGAKAFVLLPDGSQVELPAGSVQPLSKLLAAQGVPLEGKASLEDLEAAIEPKVRKYLSEQYRKAADEIRNAGKSVRPNTNTKAEGLDPAIVDELGLDLGPGITTIMRRHWPKALEQAFAGASAALSLDLAFDVENEQVQKVLDQLAHLVVRVTETTRAQIRDLVGRQAHEGWSIEQLAKEIAALDEIHSRKRARVIARTETASAYSQGSLLAYRLSDVVERVKWLATIDDLTCEHCRALNGTTTKLGEAFADGTQAPPRHPNCRCAVAPVIK